MLSRTLILLSLTLTSFSASAQTPLPQVLPGRFLVEFEGEPLASFEQAQRKSGNTRAALATEQHRNAIRTRHATARSLLQARGIRIRGTIEVIGNAIAVEGATIEQLRDLPGVKAIRPVRLLYARMDRALEILKLNEAWERLGGVTNAGAGLKIAIIDTGIDATHQAFQDASMTAPDGFPAVSSEENRPFTSGKIIVARSYQGTARDCEGHGTGVAMAAAGVRHSVGTRTISGVAPKAWLGIYRASDSCDGTFPTDNVELAMEDAVKDGMDIINLSLGTAGVETIASDTFQPYINRAIDAGVMVVSAAGNDGPDIGTIGDTSSGRAIAVGATNSSVRSSAAGVTFGAETIVGTPGSNSSQTPPLEAKARDIAAFDSSRLGCDPYPADAGLADRVAVVSRGTCDFTTKFANAARAGAAAIIVYNNQGDNELINMASDSATIPGMFISRLNGEKLRAALSADPELDLRLVFATSLPADPTQVTDFSSIGPTADLAIKPDLVATGIVLTAIASAVSPPNSYAIASGTSISSPIVAGAAALLKQHRPGLSVAQYHSLLANSATGVPGSVMSTGAGRLNITAALSNNLVSAPISLSFGQFRAETALSREFTLTNIGQGSEFYSARIVSENEILPQLSLSDFSLAPGASQALTLRFADTTFAPGQYQGVIEFTGSNGSASRVPYWMGSRGTEPSRISLVFSPASAPANERVTVVFRLIDDSSVPFDSGNPDIESVSGGGTVSTVQYGGDTYPGSFIASLRLGRLPGTNVFRIKAGNLEREFRIRGGN